MVHYENTSVIAPALMSFITDNNMISTFFFFLQNQNGFCYRVLKLLLFRFLWQQGFLLQGKIIYFLFFFQTWLLIGELKGVLNGSQKSSIWVSSGTQFKWRSILVFSGVVAKIMGFQIAFFQTMTHKELPTKFQVVP